MLFLDMLVKVAGNSCIITLSAAENDVDCRKV